MITTGLFGGSFNPIHNGHILVAQNVIKAQLADEVWMLVSPQNPFKKDIEQTGAQQRLRWAQKAVADLPHIAASDFEFALPQPNYTFVTLQRLRQEYPERIFKLTIGADNWQAFPRWKNHEEILQTTPIIVYPRPGYPVDKATLPENVTLLEMEEFNISATQLRQMLREGKSIKGLVPESIRRSVERKRILG